MILNKWKTSRNVEYTLYRDLQKKNVIVSKNKEITIQEGNYSSKVQDKDYHKIIYLNKGLFFPRSRSRKIKIMASNILDLPAPFSPTITVLNELLLSSNWIVRSWRFLYPSI